MNRTLPKFKELKIVKNTTQNYELQFRKDGQVVDITDWTVYFTVKEKMEDEDSEAIIAKTITSHSDPENGKTLIELAPSDTNQDAGSYYYSIDIKDDEAEEKVLFSGKLIIEKAVRKSRP